MWIKYSDLTSKVLFEGCGYDFIGKQVDMHPSQDDSSSFSPGSLEDTIHNLILVQPKRYEVDVFKIKL